MRAALLALSLVAAAAFARAEVFFEETFDKTWESRWVQSTARENLGAFVHSPGKFYADAVADAGIKTSQDARFYNLAAAFPAPFSNKGKDLVLQLQVKHEQDIDCGGGYVKVLNSAKDLKSFDNNTPYNIMFGPDICGSTKRVHVIFTYKGENKLIKKTINAKGDDLSHLYTLIVHPDQTYEVLIDLESAEKGSLLEDWDFLPPRKIKDPAASKPADWDERAKIPDPEDKKPEGWDDIPEFIPDPDAVKPEDWDDDMDGQWEANKVPNSEYKGAWRAREIPNPDYKGIWVHPEIDNPEFVEDKEIYAFDSHAAIGLDLWQVKSGTIFDNILLTDDVDYAKSFAEKTFSVLAKAEKEKKAAADEVERKKREEEAAKAKEEADKKAEANDSFDEEEEVDDEL